MKILPVTAGSYCRIYHPSSNGPKQNDKMVKKNNHTPDKKCTRPCWFALNRSNFSLSNKLLSTSCVSIVFTFDDPINSENLVFVKSDDQLFNKKQSSFRMIFRRKWSRFILKYRRGLIWIMIYSICHNRFGCQLTQISRLNKLWSAKCTSNVLYATLTVRWPIRFSYFKSIIYTIILLNSVCFDEYIEIKIKTVKYYSN